MVLADTSVWVSHLREGNIELKELLENGDVVCHEFIIGELACGNLKNRDAILSLFNDLPLIETVDFDEVLLFIKKNKLTGKGLGFIDVHLLASAVLSEVPLWTLDKKLKKAASELGIGYK
jgi:hypothetical protein